MLADHSVSSRSRLSVTQRSGLLDSPPEESFDALTRLAAALLEAPVSFLAVVDVDRDFYKSQIGLPEPLAADRQLAGRTFCHFALAGDGPLVIEDTHAHPVWRAVPTVDSLGVRAYLGIPLRVNGEAIGSLCVVDAAPRKWTPLQIDTLSQLGKSAAREIELRNALEAARTEAGRANDLARAKEELVAVVAHDLRSPMQVIGACSTMLARENSPVWQPHGTRIDSALASMKRLVEDLTLDAASTGGARNHAGAVGVKSLVDDAARTMSTLAERSGLRVQVAGATDAIVWVDYAQMLRVMCNLIGNAIKFCPPGSTVWLLGVDVNDEVVLSVTDDGPGMRKEDQDHAFDRGWRAATGSEDVGGSGLGLFIVRQLVEHNAGVVRLSGEPGLGIEVTIRLPRHRQTDPASAHDRAPPGR